MTAVSGLPWPTCSPFSEDVPVTCTFTGRFPVIEAAFNEVKSLPVALPRLGVIMRPWRRGVEDETVPEEDDVLAIVYVPEELDVPEDPDELEEPELVELETIVPLAGLPTLTIPVLLLPVEDDPEAIVPAGLIPLD